MKRVVFSDLHGNLAALKQLLVSERGPYLSVGDVLGTGGDNAGCLQAFREHEIATVSGNHETRLLHLYSLEATD